MTAPREPRAPASVTFSEQTDGDDVEASGTSPRLYRDLADWYPLLTPVGDYAEEAAFYRRMFETRCPRAAAVVKHGLHER